MGILREDKGMGGTVLRKFNITAEQVCRLSVPSVNINRPFLALKNRKCLRIMMKCRRSIA